MMTHLSLENNNLNDIHPSDLLFVIGCRSRTCLHCCSRYAKPYTTSLYLEN